MPGGSSRGISRTRALPSEHLTSVTSNKPAVDNMATPQPFVTEDFEDMDFSGNYVGEAAAFDPRTAGIKNMLTEKFNQTVYVASFSRTDQSSADSIAPPL